MKTKLADLFEGPHLDEDARSSILASFPDVPAEELVAQLHRSVHVLTCFTDAAESMDVMTYLLLSDADMRAREALRRLEA